MSPIDAHTLCGILGARLAAGDGAVRFSGSVCTDTRSLGDGCLFVALKGERFDGNSFAAQALTDGAAIVIVSEWRGEAPIGTAVLVVPDTLHALQQLAAWWRGQLDIPVVAITGSNGKTSTKDFTAAVLGMRFAVSATKGNLNNHIGVPITVLATETSHGAGVWEMGMNHAGEIAPLCEIAKPKFSIITNIGTAHIEFLGTQDAIAAEKGEVARCLPSDGTLIVPADCRYLDLFRSMSAADIVTTGGESSPVRAENMVIKDRSAAFDLVIDGEETVRVELPVSGRHMVANALLAAALGWKLGLSSGEIATGLSGAKLTGGRLGSHDCNGVTVIDDTYNANPESMAAAIETLAEQPLKNGARRFIVLGRMGELGPHAEQAHRRVGALAAEKGLTVLAVGEGAELIGEAAGAPFFPDFESAANWLKAAAKEDDVVLFKGSRTATIERVMHAAFPKHS
jgi:UDP-N-acetylmuramoyl-tripeptide--D-alanyl-D-alanine ligase